jgi:hypothetical protein
LHLFLSAPKGRWRVKETCLEELTLLLSAACSGAQRVVLDPMGEIWAHKLNCLLSMSPESFLSHLLPQQQQVALGSTRNG